MNYRKHFASLLLLFTTSLYVNAQQGVEKWEESLQNFEKNDKENPPQEGSILFVGSSSFTIWKDLNESYPEYDIINRAFGGSKFTDVIHFADRVIYPYKPSKIFVYEGDNDVASGKKIRHIMKDAKQLREMIKTELPGVPVVFVSAKPSVKRWHLKKDYEKLNKKLKKYANKEDLTMFADVYSAMLDENGMVYDHIFLEDDLHMNAEGYKIWQKALAPYLPDDRKD